MHHPIEWFKERAGKYVYRNSTVPVWKDTEYKLFIPPYPKPLKPTASAKKKKAYERNLRSVEKEMLRLFASQTLWGLEYLDTRDELKELSTVTL